MKPVSKIGLIILLLIQLAFVTSSIGQETNKNETQKRQTIFTRKNIVIATLAVQQTGSFIIEYKWWWKDDYHPFIIESDGWFNNYSLGIDKVGHLYTSYMYFCTLNEMMKWGGFSEKTRTITSVVLPFAYALSIELGDGFSSYNFSPEDLLCNTAGIGYGVLQDKVPYLRNFNFKFSYFPSQRYIDNHFNKWSLTSDYDGHIYWLTMNVHNTLPQSMQKGWPEFLNLAIGYGVNNFSTPGIQREYFIGLDYNLDAIKTKNNSLKTTLNILDKFHFFAPGIKQTDGEQASPKWLILN